MTGREKKKSRPLSIIYRWTSLGVNLSEMYPTKFYCNLRARLLLVRVQIPRQVDAC